MIFKINLLSSLVQFVLGEQKLIFNKDQSVEPVSLDFDAEITHVLVICTANDQTPIKQ
jgi:hypothetical protein